MRALRGPEPDGVRRERLPGLRQALRDGRVRVVPAAVGLTPHGLQVADGSVIDADVVILATGFRCASNSSSGTFEYSTPPVAPSRRYLAR
jgi:hypothetical protein